MDLNFVQYVFDVYNQLIIKTIVINDVLVVVLVFLGHFLYKNTKDLLREIRERIKRRK